MRGSEAVVETQPDAAAVLADGMHLMSALTGTGMGIVLVEEVEHAQRQLGTRNPALGDDMQVGQPVCRDRFTVGGAAHAVIGEFHASAQAGAGQGAGEVDAAENAWRVLHPGAVGVNGVLRRDAAAQAGAVVPRLLGGELQAAAAELACTPVLDDADDDIWVDLEIAKELEG